MEAAAGDGEWCIRIRYVSDYVHPSIPSDPNIVAGLSSSAVDEISGEPVAIKLVTRVTQKVQLAKRALRELTLLRHFSHENITGLIDVDISPNFDEM